MEEEKLMKLEAPIANLVAIQFEVLTDNDMKKFAVMQVKDTSDVCDPKLGVPNPSSSSCTTCGSTSIRSCHGHCGFVELPTTIYHPALIHEMVQILNKICPSCKCLRRRKDRVRGTLELRDDLSKEPERTSTNDCKYCDLQRQGCHVKQLYPLPKFKFTSKDLIGRRCLGIMIEVKDGMLADDYWDFMSGDSTLEANDKNLTKRILSPYQAFCLLRDLDPAYIRRHIARRESLFLSFVPVTPNRYRIVESNLCTVGQVLVPDEHTKSYKRLVSGIHSSHGREDIVQVVGGLALECFNSSKLNAKSSSNPQPGSHNSGLRWLKDVVLGKRSDFAFRLTVIGDPNLHLGEIGIPVEISKRLLVRLPINLVNLANVKSYVESHLHEKTGIYLRRRGQLIPVDSFSSLQVDDVLYVNLKDGDLILVNRPPSVHQHSLIAFKVRVLPFESVISINPLCCRPFSGDFDGDCLHGFVPQSINARVELQELLTLERQLINGQNGQPIVSLSHDSLTAAYMITKCGTLFDKFQIQQLSMFVPGRLMEPAILKSPRGPRWTGEQFFSMLLPSDFEHKDAVNGIIISNGQLLLASQDSGWLHNYSDSIVSKLLKGGEHAVIDYLFYAQKAFCEWLSITGLTVSLKDVYLTSDMPSRKKMMDELNCGLDDAECLSNLTYLMMSSESQYDLIAPCSKYKVFAGRSNKNLPSLGCNLGYAFKKIYHDIVKIILEHAERRNSMLMMIGAGSSGSIQKLVQQGACLGLQSLRDVASFTDQFGLSVLQWSPLREYAKSRVDCSQEQTSFAVVRGSFLTGLSPVECLLHSASIRGGSFSDNADVPGTLARKLMFYMRDLQVSYDGTIRNPYGNQVIQFSYNYNHCKHQNDQACYLDKFFSTSAACLPRELEIYADARNAGDPVGALAACSISEALYGALDHIASSKSSSPLLQFKEVLDCGGKSTAENSTALLYLSQELGQWRYGYEYGALEVKRHLERVTLSDVAESVLVSYCKDVDVIFPGQTNSPWVVHIHLSKETLRKRDMTLGFIISALRTECGVYRQKARPILPQLHILSGKPSLCHRMAQHNDTFCIMVAKVSAEEESTSAYENSHPVNVMKILVIPVLLQTTIRGLSQIKQVDILWKDHRKLAGLQKSGELYVMVVSENCKPKKMWHSLKEACIVVSDLIDWKRSQPANVNDVFHGFGVGVAWKCFVDSLKSVICDLGKTIHEEHLVIIADCLSVTGEFHGLNGKGIKQQRNQMSFSSPFMQACFSNPVQWFTKAAKKGDVDNLCGALEAVAWGKDPKNGSLPNFDILCSKEVGLSVNSGDVYKMLCNSGTTSRKGSIPKPKPSLQLKSFFAPSDIMPEVNINAKCAKISSWLLLMKLFEELRDILYKYGKEECINEQDKCILLKALTYHPRGNEKVGSGVQDIKIGSHEKYPQDRCFVLVRTDGTEEDFSYRKCVAAIAGQSSLALQDEFERRYRRGKA